jgi:Ca2+-binding EF-hand superfamily protein
MMLIFTLMLTFPASHLCISNGELGDSLTSDQSRNGFFAELDNDGNGKITVQELTEVILILSCTPSLNYSSL